MGVIDGEYLDNQQRKHENKSISERIVSALERMSYEHYPVRKEWDCGESVDINEAKREAFVMGGIVTINTIYGDE
jgi:hypothetical protein